MQMVKSKQRGFVAPLGLFLLLGLSITGFAWQQVWDV
jgi:hypothetical protein